MSAPEMQQITSLKELAPFAGTLVAYTASGAKNAFAYTIGKTGTLFGYIAKQAGWTDARGRRGDGYRFSQLVQPNSLKSGKVITASALEEGSFSVSLPTQDELRQIIEDLGGKRALLEWIPNAVEVLTEQLSREQR